jgi:hypothetical protein
VASGCNRPYALMVGRVPHLRMIAVVFLPRHGLA